MQTYRILVSLDKRVVLAVSSDVPQQNVLVERAGGNVLHEHEQDREGLCEPAQAWTSLRAAEDKIKLNGKQKQESHLPIRRELRAVHLPLMPARAEMLSFGPASLAPSPSTSHIHACCLYQHHGTCPVSCIVGASKVLVRFTLSFVTSCPPCSVLCLLAATICWADESGLPSFGLFSAMLADASGGRLGSSS
eukprot:1152155-Pelagomonas_calceolata.AAC.1